MEGRTSLVKAFLLFMPSTLAHAFSHSAHQRLPKQQTSHLQPHHPSNDFFPICLPARLETPGGAGPISLLHSQTPGVQGRQEKLQTRSPGPGATLPPHQGHTRQGHSKACPLQSQIWCLDSSSGSFGTGIRAVSSVYLVG